MTRANLTAVIRSYARRLLHEGRGLLALRISREAALLGRANRRLARAGQWEDVGAGK